MGKNSGLKNLLRAFIDSIPDDKLSGFLGPGIQFSDANFRLDMQGVTSGGAYNLQVQVNKGTNITSLKLVAPRTVAGPVFVVEGDPKTPDQIRAELRAVMVDLGGENMARQPSRGMSPGKGGKRRK